MNSIRLSYFNIRKHRIESISLAIIIGICMMLICTAIICFSSIDNIYNDLQKATECKQNYIMCPNTKYHEEYYDYVSNDPRVSSLTKCDAIYEMYTKYIDKSDEECALSVFFVTQDTEEKIENFNCETSLSTEQIDEASHPIYVPYYIKDTLKMNEGETFTIVYNGKKYPFTIVGFYESGVFAESNIGLKLIVTDDDFRYLTKIMEKSATIAFSLYDQDDILDFISDFEAKSEEIADQDATYIQIYDYNGMKQMGTIGSYTMLSVMLIMSAIIFITVLFMMSYRIKSDIEEQIVSIGVLEALGYKSVEISLSYVYEYLFLSLAGMILGIIGSCFFVPFFFNLGLIMTGHHGKLMITIIPILVSIAFFLVFVSSIAYFKACLVKRYPPVVAFRKGYKSHSFRKCILPLDKTIFSVNLRISIKGFLESIKSNVGLAVCIILLTMCLLISYLFANYFSDDLNAIERVTGIELSDLRIELINPDDTESLARDIRKYDEVQKVNTTCDMVMEHIKVNGNDGVAVVYENYETTDNIKADEGRNPLHDNEVMISKITANTQGLNVGDEVVCSRGKIEKKYIVSGIITSITNSGCNTFFTDEGYRRLKPNFKHNIVDVYLKEGVDSDEFSALLSSKFGKTVSDTLDEDATGMGLEERIKSIADKKMAVLLAEYGASSIDYTIIIDGKEISGNSGSFKIKSITSLKKILKTQLSGYVLALGYGTKGFMVISLMVVAIMIYMLMESSVRKLRYQFGIYKSLGYTAGELRIQLAMRIFPAIVFAIFAGDLLTMIVLPVLLDSTVGKIPVEPSLILFVDVLFIIASVLSLAFGTRKINRISVCELISD